MIQLKVAIVAGIAAIWQQGGGSKDFGEALVIGDAYGRPKTAVEIARGSERDHNHHCAIPISQGDILLMVEKTKRHTAEKVYTLDQHDGIYELLLLNERVDGRWKVPPRTCKQLAEMVAIAEEIASRPPHKATYFRKL